MLNINLEYRMKHVVFTLCFLILLTGCAKRQEFVDIDTTNVYQLENATAISTRSDPEKAKTSALRYRVLKDTAMSIGAQGGLAWASEQMNTRMLKDRKYLDTIFNFNSMVLSHGIMPPVLEEGDHSLNLADADTIRVADKTYRIVEQARFATTPPNWREYLILTYEKPPLPNRSLLPRNEDEQKVWRHAVHQGWEKGIEQGYSIFAQNISRLKRDFYGMMLYRKLLQQKMINPPFVARTELGVTGDGTDMRINDQVLRIVDHPQLQTNSRNWRAVVINKDTCCNG